MKATIKFEDGRQATIELTPEQLKAVNERQGFELGQYYFHCGYTPIHNFLDRPMDISIHQLHTLKQQSHGELLQSRFELELEMFRWASEMNEGWVPDWGKSKVVKWGISFQKSGLYLDSYQYCNFFVFSLSFKSKEIAEQAVELFGDRILSLYGKQF